jgi:hypothetical protein
MAPRNTVNRNRNVAGELFLKVRYLRQHDLPNQLYGVPNLMLAVDPPAMIFDRPCTDPQISSYFLVRQSKLN